MTIESPLSEKTIFQTHSHLWNVGNNQRYEKPIAINNQNNQHQLYRVC